MIVKTKEYGTISAPKKTLTLLEAILLHAKNQYYTDMECAGTELERDYFEMMFNVCVEIGLDISDELMKEENK